MSTATEFKQGIREHLGQFSLHVLLVFATGLTIGSERTVVPVLSEDVLGVESFLVIGSFVVSFGFVKALLNLYAGKWGEEYGRKPVLILGWATALPLPIILIFAPSWGWITVGNILLGINQALTWSMAINAKIDLAGPEQRGLAVGIDESFGYTGVAVGAWITGVIAGQWNLRPEPFYFLAVVVILAFLISIFLIKETVQYAQAEGDDDHHDANLPFNEVLKRATYGDKTLFAAAQAGHIENFVDTLFWIAVPLYLINQGLGIAAVGVVVGVHSAMYFLQIATGGLADRIGRRPPVVWGMFIAGAGVLGMVLVEGYLSWAVLAAISGLGMALLYPNLMTVPSDAAHPTWRSAGMGVYRMWRDSGYAVGAILIGLSMEFVNAEAAFYMTALLMFVSGVVVYIWMEETHPDFGTHEPPAPATEPPIRIVSEEASSKPSDGDRPQRASLEIRNATADDIPEIMEIYHSAYKENERMGFPSSVLECDTNDVTGWLRNRTVFVATCENEIVGVVQLIPRSDWDMPEIGRLAVSLDHQGEGIGQSLLEFAEEHAKAEGQDSIRLRTFSGHPFLGDWYQQEGYERVRIERFSNHPYDALIMEKKL